MSTKKDLLIVFHSQSGATERLSAAVESGARKVQGVRVRRLPAHETQSLDLRQSGVVVVCSPEYFGYMAGAIKDLFDRTYEDVRDHMIGTPYAVVISAGNDGLGALNSIERIIAGIKLRKVQEPIISRGDVDDSTLERCAELGQTLAAGLELGIY